MMYYLTKIAVTTALIVIISEVARRSTLAGAILAAFAGAFLGRRLLHKVKLLALYRFVGFFLIVAGFAIAAGLL